MITEGPYPLTLGDPLQVNLNQLAQPPYGVSLQNLSGFICQVMVGAGMQWVLPWSAQYVDISPSDAFFTITPMQDISPTSGDPKQLVIQVYQEGDSAPVTSYMPLTAAAVVAALSTEVTIAPGQSVSLAAGTEVNLPAGTTVDIGGTPTVNLSAGTAVEISNDVTVTPSGTIAVQGVAGGTTVGVTGTVDIGSTNTVTIGNTPSVTVASGTIDLAAGTSVDATISGTPTFDLAAGATVDLASGAAVEISGTPTVNLSAGTAVEISNDVTVTPSGTISVQGVAGGTTVGVTGTVDIGATNTVTIGNTPSVTVESGTIDLAAGTSVDATISGTPTFNLAAGTSVDVNAGTVDVQNVAGGFLQIGDLPAQSLTIVNNSGSFTVGPVNQGYKYLVVQAAGGVPAAAALITVTGNTTGLSYAVQTPCSNGLPAIIPIDPATDNEYTVVPAVNISSAAFNIGAAWASSRPPHIPEMAKHRATFNAENYGGGAVTQVGTEGTITTEGSISRLLSWSANIVCTGSVIQALGIRVQAVADQSTTYTYYLAAYPDNQNAIAVDYGPEGIIVQSGSGASALTILNLSSSNAIGFVGCEVVYL